MPNDQAFHQGHTGYVVVGDERMPVSRSDQTVPAFVRAETYGESDLKGVLREIAKDNAMSDYASRILGGKGAIPPEPSLPDLPAHVASVLLEKYAGMRESAQRARAHYYRLDEEVTQAEQEWMETRAQAKQMESFLRRSGVPVTPVED